MPQTLSSPSSSARAYLYLLVTTAIWGSLYVVTRIALQTVPPITLLFFRYVVASLTLAIMVRVSGKDMTIEARDRGAFLFIGAVGYFISTAANIAGTKFAGASLSSLINSTNPIFISLFAVLYLKEGLGAGKILALVAALAGAYVVLGGAKTPEVAWGIFFALLSVLIWAFITVFVRKITRRYDPLVVTAWAIHIATVCALPAVGVELALTPHGRIISPTNLLCFLYLGSFATALPNTLWNKSLSLVDASTCSLFYPIQPLVSALLGALFLGERLSLRFWAGAGLIVGGILFALVPGRRGRGGAQGGRPGVARNEEEEP